MQTKTKKRISLSAVLLYGVLLLLALVKLLNGKDNIKFVNYEVTHALVPEAFDGYTIVQLSDIHYGRHTNVPLLEETIEAINDLSPDMVVLTGDQIDVDTKYLDACYQLMSQIEAPTYAIFGNHEDRQRYKASLETIESYNIPLLQNDYTRIYKGDDSIYLAGLRDLTVDEPDMDQALEGREAHDFVIMLAHNPALYSQADHDKVQLMFSGHNHGGQITFFGLFAPVLSGPDRSQKYVTGHIQEDKSHLIVSNGIGTTKIPVRLFADPQVTVTTLHKQD